jgi:protein phosphatase
MTAPVPHTETPPSVVAGRKPRDDEIDVYGLTHPGKIRKSNQDHFLLGSLRKHLDILLTSLPATDRLALEDERLAFLALVADGVGGSAKGEEASRLTLEQVTQYVAQSSRVYYGADTNEATFMNALEDAALQIHADLLERGTQNPELRGMATTLTVWLGVWPWYYLLQVGDSRYYLYRDGKLNQISRDQTMAQDLMEQGVLTRTDAMNSRWAHVLSSAIGGPQAAPVVTRLHADWRNVHLLCSDGLTKEVSDDRIRDMLANMTSAKQVCEDLLQEALNGGGSDNITIIVGRAIPKPLPS